MPEADLFSGACALSLLFITLSSKFEYSFNFTIRKKYKITQGFCFLYPTNENTHHTDCLYW